MAKIRVVAKLAQDPVHTEEEKTIRVKLPVSLHEALIENAKMLNMKPDRLLVLAAQETDVFDEPNAKAVAKEKPKSNHDEEAKPDASGLTNTNPPYVS